MLTLACLIILHSNGTPLPPQFYPNLPKAECSARAAFFRTLGYGVWTEYGHFSGAPHVK